MPTKQWSASGEHFTSLLGGCMYLNYINTFFMGIHCFIHLYLKICFLPLSSYIAFSPIHLPDIFSARAINFDNHYHASIC